MVDLGSLPGANYTSATAANFDGSLVVGFSINSGTHAFRWQAGSGLTPLPELPGASFSEATAVSYDGSVIVGNIGFASGPGAAVVWTSSGVQSIQDLLVANGVKLHGWILGEVIGVSADGTVVAGTGWNPKGQEMPWIARIADSPGPLSYEDGRSTDYVTRYNRAVEQCSLRKWPSR